MFYCSFVGQPLIICPNKSLLRLLYYSLELSRFYKIIQSFVFFSRWLSDIYGKKYSVKVFSSLLNDEQRNNRLMLTCFLSIGMKVLLSVLVILLWINFALFVLLLSYFCFVFIPTLPLCGCGTKGQLNSNWAGQVIHRSTQMTLYFTALSLRKRTLMKLALLGFVMWSLYTTLWFYPLSLHWGKCLSIYEPSREREYDRNKFDLLQ